MQARRCDSQSGEENLLLGAKPTPSRAPRFSPSRTPCPSPGCTFPSQALFPHTFSKRQKRNEDSMSKHEVTVELAGGKRLVFETGRMAKQASGAALVTTGETVVLSTAVASPDPREGIDFFPLTVDYREYTYAGGRIPGGFIKREGRMSEREVLTSRQIDRPVRPMFAEGFRNETQVIAFVLSADTENDPDVCGINAASAALTVSDIPFLGPIGAVRVGLVDGRFIANPTYSEMREGLLNIMVVGTAEAILMIESGAKEVKEETVVDAIEFAHTEIKKICAAIEELRSKAGKPKRKVTPPEFDQAYYNDLQSKIGARLT